MDNLRKSFRVSLRRKKDKDSSGSGDFVKDRTGGSSKSKLWQQDEIAVRAGTCRSVFQRVTYIRLSVE